MGDEFSGQPVVAAVDSVLQKTAQELASALQLTYVGVVSDVKQAVDPLLLWVTFEGFKLQQTGKKAPGPVWADFVTGAVAHRRKFGGGSGQMIAKAVGIKGGVRPTVLDATAGLGKDSFVLATLGCEVTMTERSPVVHALLADGLARALQDEEVADIAQRMSLQQANAIEYITQMNQAQRPQVIYLDPMFPHTDKTALVKKEMRIFRDVVGDDHDASGLLEAAIEKAIARVVVKRPRKSPTINERKPSYQLEGKSSRYDIYALSKLV